MFWLLLNSSRATPCTLALGNLFTTQITKGMQKERQKTKAERNSEIKKHRNSNTREQRNPVKNTQKQQQPNTKTNKRYKRRNSLRRRRSAGILEPRAEDPTNNDMTQREACKITKIIKTTLMNSMNKQKQKSNTDTASACNNSISNEQKPRDTP